MRRGWLERCLVFIGICTVALLAGAAVKVGIDHITAKGISGVLGEGLVYGPRENRQSVVVYDDHGQISIEITLYGPPDNDTDPYGPQVARAVTTLPEEVRAWLAAKIQ